ncbi:PrsW family glutamic-type intramembrane protease [Pseudanabaena sp. PCC 6802]|uniref:PrsW family glutamic-type intramembrane protease n=1 Tax=Pseudanabaena sp. PCC 6802 TaxID=118173 RepID=UPI000346BAA7|nr:PrsW family glutamic-type intramembrane protease [Pseudanabaena sp. PCC 6802]
MTNGRSPQGFLIRISSTTDSDREVISLFDDIAIVIGRDPRCDVAIDPELYGSVSRRHAEIRANFNFGVRRWEICDLDSANGTFINGQRLSGCQVLQIGDRITLSQKGPIFEFQTDDRSYATRLEANSGSHQPTSLTLTQLVPIISTGGDLFHKAYLVPAIFTVLSVVLLFASLGNTWQFNLVLSVYISAAAYYFVYQLCQKPKPWWVLLGVTLTTILIIRSPILRLFIWFFREILPGSPPTGDTNFLIVLVNMFFGTGLMEELLKALPVLAVWGIGDRLKQPWRDRIGVFEPLDGILLGTASAVGFTLLETLGQYVPLVTQAAGNEAGLQILIPRVLGSVSGHMAYSGYLGYFIGLSVLKPTKRWQILGVGYISASLLHALWNAFSTLGGVNQQNFWLLSFVGILSYAFLAAAILKARTFSPKRKTSSGGGTNPAGNRRRRPARNLNQTIASPDLDSDKE